MPLFLLDVGAQCPHSGGKEIIAREVAVFINSHDFPSLFETDALACEPSVNLARYHREKRMRCLRALTAATALLCVAAPAWAGGSGDPGQHRNGPAIIGGVGGAGGVGGSGGAGGIGGTGGSATARSAAGAAAGASAVISPGAGAATIAPGAINAGGNNVTTLAPPGFALPSFGGGQCATVGFGIAISPSGGGAFGPAWESTNCRNYYIAVTLIQAGRVDQGMRLLSMITPEAAAVMAPTPVAATGQTAPAVAPRAARPAWCNRAKPSTDASRDYFERECRT